MSCCENNVAANLKCRAYLNLFISKIYGHQTNAIVWPLLHHLFGKNGSRVLFLEYAFEAFLVR